MLEVMKIVEAPRNLVGVGLSAEIAIPEIQRILGPEGMPLHTEYKWFRPRYYLNPDDAKHGLQHTGETTVIALLHARLAKAFGYQVNWYQAGEAAGHHDIMHPGGDIIDDLHGEAAAAWYEQHAIGEHKGKIANAIRLHVPPDPPICDNLTKILKDADSLNRVRFGDEKWGLDLKFLRFDYAADLLVQPVILLHQQTNIRMLGGRIDGYEAAGLAAVDIGLMPTE